MLHTIVHLVLLCFGIVLFLATLPLTIELLVLPGGVVLAPRGSAALTSGVMTMPEFALAVVIPAHNEQELIGECIRSVLAQAAPKVYVIAHNCSDRTAEQARLAGAEALILDDSAGGKGVALDFGFHHALAAGAQAVLVIDADSIAGPNLIAAVAAAFAAGAEAVQCRYEVANSNATPRTRIAALAFLGMNVLRPFGRSRLGLSCGIFGNGFGLSAATLARVPYVANSLVEDLEYHLHLIRAGITVKFLAKVAVYGEMPETSAASASQRARWEGGRIHMRRKWRMPLLREVLRGRLSLLDPLLDLVAVPLATQCILLLLAAAVALTAKLLWLFLYAAVGLFAVMAYPYVAASLAADPVQSLQALLSAPPYVLWKLMLIPRTRLAARPDAAWVRTKRNAEGVAREE